MAAPIEKCEPNIVNEDHVKVFLKKMGVPHVEGDVLETFNSMLLDVLNKQVANTLLIQDNQRDYNLTDEAAKLAINRVMEYGVARNQ